MPSISAAMSPRWEIGHADLADLAARELVVGVIAGLRRQVEGDRQAGLALCEVAPVQLVGRLRRRVPGVGAHHPRPVALGQPRGLIAAHASIVRSRRGLYPPGMEQTDRAAARRRAGKRPGRRVEGDRPQRRPQHLRPRRAHARALHPRRRRSQRGHEIANVIHSSGQAIVYTRHAGARRALLGAAQGRGADDGPARAGLRLGATRPRRSPRGVAVGRGRWPWPLPPASASPVRISPPAVWSHQP